MPLPIHLVLVRHGESEGNLVNRSDRAGDSSMMTPEHLARHTSEYRLTDRGIKQAQAAGKWIRENIPGRFDYCVSSPFLRAIETAAYLGLDQQWEQDPYLVERDHGELDGMPAKERIERFGSDYAKRYLSHFYRRPPNGESRLDLGLRWDRIMLSLSQRHPDHRVLIVAHETIIECGMIRRLHWTIDEFCRWKEENDPATKVNNCQVIHFSRRNPETQETIDHIRWWRTVWPWDPTLTSGEWRPIEKQLFTSEELLAQANQYPRLFAK